MSAASAVAVACKLIDVEVITASAVAVAAMTTASAVASNDAPGRVGTIMIIGAAGVAVGSLLDFLVAVEVAVGVLVQVGAGVLVAAGELVADGVGV